MALVRDAGVGAERMAAEAVPHIEMARAQSCLLSREASSCTTDWVMTGIGTSMCNASSTSQFTSPVSSTYEGTLASPPFSRYMRSINSTSQERMTEPCRQHFRMASIGSFSR